MAYDYNPQFNFKPEFGNLAHINIIKAMDNLGKKHIELKRKRDAQKGGDTLEKECIRLKSQIDLAIKHAHETNTKKAEG